MDQRSRSHAQLALRRPMNQIAEREFIERISKGDSVQVLGIMTRPEDEFIGTTGFHAIDWQNRTRASESRSA